MQRCIIIDKWKLQLQSPLCDICDFLIYLQEYYLLPTTDYFCKSHWCVSTHWINMLDTVSFLFQYCLLFFDFNIIVYTIKWCNDMQNALKPHDFYSFLICCLIVLICHRAPTLFAHALHDPVIGFADGRLWILSAKPNARHQFPAFNTCILPPPPLLSFHHPFWTLFQDELP